jgi:hypothetical protein
MFRQIIYSIILPVSAISRKLCILLIISMVHLFSSCQNAGNSSDTWEDFSGLREQQLSFGEEGHYLHTTQVFSPDDQWIAFDGRNKGSDIGKTCCVAVVHTSSKELRVLYQTTGQTEYGPGVGGVTFNPVEPLVLFIHGLQNCDRNHPYGFSRRTGVGIHMSQPGKPIFMDARDVIPPFTPGALRGGSHAHTWSGDGQWISFTYNDDLMTKLENKGVSGKMDLRMVGVMAPYGPVRVPKDGLGENLDGNMFSVVVSRVTEFPAPGSNQIDRAYSDGWVGKNGYMKGDGSWQKRAVAFLGDTRDERGNKVTEVYLADIPEDVRTRGKDGPLAGSENERPFPPERALQRRLTYTAQRTYPGVQGPRHWLRSAPDGSMIYFLMKDDRGIVQICGVSPEGGEVQYFTQNEFPVETTFSVSPNGKFLAYGFDQKVYLTNLESGETKAVSPQPAQGMTALKSICWSNDGGMLAYNRTVAAADSSYVQVFLLK